MRNLSSVLMNIDLLLTELKCHLPCAEANGNVRVFGESGFTHADIQKGRTLSILDGGDTVEVSSYRDTTINGTESHHVRPF